MKSVALVLFVIVRFDKVFGSPASLPQPEVDQKLFSLNSCCHGFQLCDIALILPFLDLLRVSAKNLPRMRIKHYNQKKERERERERE